MKNLIFIALSISFIVSCKKNDLNDSSSQPFVSYFSDTTSNKATGGNPATVEELQNIPFAEDIDTALIPKLKSVNILPSSWSINVPPPANQGKNMNSCVGWAVAYGMLSYDFNKPEGKSGYFDSEDVFSPMYVYNQLNGGENKGIPIPAALNLIESQGCCKMTDMSDKFDYLSQPGTLAKNNAIEYKILPWYRFKDNDPKEIKKFLWLNCPLPFMAKVDVGFQNGKNETSFERKPDNSLVWKQYWSNAMIDRSWHAMLLCGYDDNKHAYKVLNSWGSSWGNVGYIWIDYDFFNTVVSNINGHPEIYLCIPKILNNATLSTYYVTSITQTSAISGGNVTNDGGSPITAKGIVWSTSPEPTIINGVNNNITSNGKGTGSFTSNLNGLSANTQYFVRAYATNTTGTSYGDEVNFTTLDYTDSCDFTFTWGPPPKLPELEGTQVYFPRNIYFYQTDSQMFYICNPNNGSPPVEQYLPVGMHFKLKKGDSATITMMWLTPTGGDFCTGLIGPNDTTYVTKTFECPKQ